MECGLGICYFSAPKGHGHKNAVFTCLSMVVLAATEVAMPLALAPTALFAVALARMEKSLPAAIVATLTFLVQGPVPALPRALWSGHEVVGPDTGHLYFITCLHVADAVAER